ncbi:hypothetical protein B0H19DRAFT_1064719 [Mycena capillaripes]|nr:hypothetical protein B0H19DRAFT_1064719 [Mycena capillaripes]
MREERLQYIEPIIHIQSKKWALTTIDMRFGGKLGPHIIPNAVIPSCLFPSAPAPADDESKTRRAAPHSTGGTSAASTRRRRSDLIGLARGRLDGGREFHVSFRSMLRTILKQSIKGAEQRGHRTVVKGERGRSSAHYLRTTTRSGGGQVQNELGDRRAGVMRSGAQDDVPEIMRHRASARLTRIYLHLHPSPSAKANANDVGGAKSGKCVSCARATSSARYHAGRTTRIVCTGAAARGRDDVCAVSGGCAGSKARKVG